MNSRNNIYILQTTLYNTRFKGIHSSIKIKYYLNRIITQISNDFNINEKFQTLVILNIT